MRLTILALASLLFACAQEGDDAASNSDARLNGQAPATAHQSASSSQPNGEAAPEPADEISLQASPQQVNAGATVQLTLVNSTEQQLGYNLCTSELRAPDGSAVKTDRVCTMELRVLKPGESTAYSFDLPGVIEDGRYQFTTNVQRMGSGDSSTVTSNSIEID